MSYEEQTKLDKVFHALIAEFSRNNRNNILFMADSTSPDAWRLEALVKEHQHILKYRDTRTPESIPFDFTATVVWDTEQEKVVWGDVNIEFETKASITQEEGVRLAEDKLSTILDWYSGRKKQPSNVTKQVQGELLGYARQLGILFIRNNWDHLYDSKDGMVSIENWSLSFNNREEEKEIFTYRSPRKENWPVKDFTLKFDLVIGDYDAVDLQGEASLGEATAIMKGILEFARPLDHGKKNMTEKSFDEEVADQRKLELTTLKNCIADMRMADIVNWLKVNWGRHKGDAGGNFFVSTERNHNGFDDEFLDQAKELILNRLAEATVPEPEVEIDPNIEDNLRRMVRSMSDKDLAVWFRNLRRNFTTQDKLSVETVGGRSYWPRSYFEAFGRLVAERLEVPRVTENMLVMDLGPDRPVNPLRATVMFATHLQEFIEKGPAEPEVRAHGQVRTISQPWIDWYRKTHSCGFDVAWREGARRLLEKEYHGRMEELGKLAWYPSPSYPLTIEVYTKLEFVQP